MKYPRLKGADLYTFELLFMNFVTVLTIYEIPSPKRSRYVYFWVAVHEFVTVSTIYEILSSNDSRDNNRTVSSTRLMFRGFSPSGYAEEEQEASITQGGLDHGALRSFSLKPTHVYSVPCNSYVVWYLSLLTFACGWRFYKKLKKKRRLMVDDRGVTIDV